MENREEERSYKRNVNCGQRKGGLCGLGTLLTFSRHSPYNVSLFLYCDVCACVLKIKCQIVSLQM